MQHFIRESEPMAHSRYPDSDNKNNLAGQAGRLSCSFRARESTSFHRIREEPIRGYNWLRMDWIAIAFSTCSVLSLELF